MTKTNVKQEEKKVIWSILGVKKKVGENITKLNEQVFFVTMDSCVSL